VRETEALVKRLLNPKPSTPPRLDPDVARLQDELTEKLCAQVRIQHNAKGRGKLVISFNSADELEGIIGHLAKT
jgi:ParB family chromosome partitioning protein